MGLLALFGVLLQSFPFTPFLIFGESFIENEKL
jgi:hypothetical protein